MSYLEFLKGQYGVPYYLTYIYKWYILFYQYEWYCKLCRWYHTLCSGKTIDSLLESLEKDDTAALIKWFRDNYLKLNADKCHLLISRHNRDITINVEEAIIECESSVKFLGVTLDNKLNSMSMFPIFVKKPT